MTDEREVYDEYGIVKNRDGRDVDVDDIRTELLYNHGILFSRDEMENVMMNFTWDEKLWYSTFVSVSSLQDCGKNADGRNNGLGHYEDIRDRLVIENYLLMMDTIKNECDRVEYDDDCNVIN